MRRRTFLAIPAVGAVATGMTLACGSFDEASGGAPDGGVPDAVGAGDASVEDAPSNGRCTGKEKLFDRFGRMLPAGANGWRLAPDAALEILDDSGATPPVLFASAPSLDSGEKLANVIAREFQLGEDNTVCVELDVLIEKGEGTFTGGSYAELFDVHATNTTSVFFELDPGGIVFTQDKTHVFVPEAVLGQWQHVVMRIPYGTTEHPSLEVDGKPSVAGDRSAGPKPTEVRVELGVEADGRGGQTTAVRVYFDNFRLTTAP